jgi:hypothetical protein
MLERNIRVSQLSHHQQVEFFMMMVVVVVLLVAVVMMMMTLSVGWKLLSHGLHM